MSHCIHLISADGQENRAVRRQLVPITIEVERPGQHLTFEKKLPFTATKVVGVMTTVSQPVREDDGCGEIEQDTDTNTTE